MWSLSRSSDHTRNPISRSHPWIATPSRQTTPWRTITPWTPTLTWRPITPDWRPTPPGTSSACHFPCRCVELTGDRPFSFINIFLQEFRPSLPIAINSKTMKTEETSSTTSLLSWIWGILGWNKPWIHIFVKVFNSTLLKLNQTCRQKPFSCLGDQSDSWMREDSLKPWYPNFLIQF